MNSIDLFILFRRLTVIKKLAKLDRYFSVLCGQTPLRATRSMITVRSQVTPSVTDKLIRKLKTIEIATFTTVQVSQIWKSLQFHLPSITDSVTRITMTFMFRMNLFMCKTLCVTIFLFLNLRRTVTRKLLFTESRNRECYNLTEKLYLASKRKIFRNKTEFSNWMILKGDVGV